MTTQKMDNAMYAVAAAVIASVTTAAVTVTAAVVSFGVLLCVDKPTKQRTKEVPKRSVFVIKTQIEKENTIRKA